MAEEELNEENQTDKASKFLESIDEENKDQIIARYKNLEDVVKNLGDLFAKDEGGNYQVSQENLNLKGLETFFDNIYIDSSSENLDEEAQKEQQKKRKDLKDETQALAVNLALQDLVQDETIDETTEKEELKRRLAEAIHDNMVFLGYNIIATQSGFDAMEKYPELNKLEGKSREEFIATIHSDSNSTMQNVTNILSGAEAKPVQVSSAAITSTMAPYHQETESFAKKFKEKTGLGDLLKRVNDFDNKMSKSHPYLWPAAKSVIIANTLGPVGIAAMVGKSTYKQFKNVRDIYKKQKAENDGRMGILEFAKKNYGTILQAGGTAVAMGFAASAGLDAIASGNFGMVGNLVSGIAHGNLSQVASTAYDMAKDKLTNLNFADATKAGGRILNKIVSSETWSPMRVSRTALSVMTGFAKASEEAMKAEKGQKWAAFRKTFTGTVAGIAVGSALSDFTNAAQQEVQQEADQQAFQNMQQEIAAGEKAFEQELKNADFSDIKIPLPPDYTAEGGELQEVTVTGHAHPHLHHHVVEEQVAKPMEKINLDEIQPDRLTPEPDLDVKIPDIDVKQVYNVNGEQVAVSQGETIEQTLDNARQEYLNQHAEIDDADNKVKIEGQGIKATITTEKEDIMSKDGEAVLGQETEVDRKIQVGDIKIKDHIETFKTDEVQAEMVKTEGRVDVNSQNNIPDGAKILNTTHIKTDTQDMTFTEYEGADGKVHITDGVHDRIAPANQSAEQRMETWKNMGRVMAEASYQESQQTATADPKGLDDQTAAGKGTTTITKEADDKTATADPKVTTTDPKVVDDKTATADPKVTTTDPKVVDDKTATADPKVTTTDPKVVDDKTAAGKVTTTGIKEADQLVPPPPPVVEEKIVTMTDERIEPASKAHGDSNDLKNLQDPSVTVIQEGFGLGESIIHHAGENPPKVDLGFGALTPVAEMFNDNQGTTTQVFLDADNNRYDKIINNADGSYHIVDGHYKETGISGNINDDKFKLNFTDEGLKVTENTVSQQETKGADQQTITTQGDVRESGDIKYTLDGNGGFHLQTHAVFSAFSPGVLNTSYIDHLMPRYEGENNSKQDFENPSNIHTTYKDSEGKYHCGNSVGSTSTGAVNAERLALQVIVEQNVVYNDLQSQGETRALTEAEQKFMHYHEQQLAERHLVNNKGGILEYQDCPKGNYYHRLHDQVAMSDPNDTSYQERIEARAHSQGIKGDITIHMDEHHAVAVGKNGIQITNEKGGTQTYVLTKEGVMNTTNPYKPLPVTDMEQLKTLKQEVINTVGEDHKLVKGLDKNIMQHLSGRAEVQAHSPVRQTSLDPTQQRQTFRT